jgi:hypothetical protein
LILDDWRLTGLTTQDRADLLEILDDRLNVRSTVFSGAAARTLSIAAANSLAGALAITGLWMGYGAVRRSAP